jgi:hypothetical protein
LPDAPVPPTKPKVLHKGHCMESYRTAALLDSPSKRGGRHGGRHGEVGTAFEAASIGTEIGPLSSN